jgi:hypothetical protein
MKSTPPPTILTAIYFVGLLAVFLLMAYLVSGMRERTAPVLLGAERSAERKRVAQELEAAAREELGTYAYIDQAHGTVRLPIHRAMQLLVEEWQNPDAGHRNLISRFERAQPPEPEPTPEEPSEFE